MTTRITYALTLAAALATTAARADHQAPASVYRAASDLHAALHHVEADLERCHLTAHVRHQANVAATEAHQLRDAIRAGASLPQIAHLQRHLHEAIDHLEHDIAHSLRFDHHLRETWRDVRTAEYRLTRALSQSCTTGADRSLYFPPNDPRSDGRFDPRFDGRFDPRFDRRDDVRGVPRYPERSSVQHPAPIYRQTQSRQPVDSRAVRAALVGQILSRIHGR